MWDLFQNVSFLAGFVRIFPQLAFEAMTGISVIVPVLTMKNNSL